MGYTAKQLVSIAEAEIGYHEKESKNMDIEKIIALLKSDSYKDRAKGEYLFVKDKYDKLHAMIIKREAGKLDFEPNCPMEQWKAQAAAMGAYLYQLEIKAAIEEIDHKGGITMGYTAEALVAIAEGEIGYHEKASNSNLNSKTANSGNKNFTKYGRDLFNAGFFNGNKNGFDWCAQFPTWCVWQLTGKNKKKTEYILCVGGDLSAGCGFALKYYKAAGRFDRNPKVGDQIFFKYSDDDSTADHTGIVVRVTDSLIETIEGNTDNQVKRNAYHRRYYAIIGYGHPRYDAEPEKETKPVAKKCTITLPILRKGSTGEAVKTLQRLLRQLQYVNADGKTLIIVDGNFGSNTEAAVKRYQQKHLNGVDGIVGVKTWNKLLNGR